MNQIDKKPCIQKQIKMLLQKILFNPRYLFIFALLLCWTTYGVMEILVFLKIFAHSYFYYLLNLDYSKGKDIVDLIVTTNASIIAFTAVTASMILKHTLEEEKDREKSPKIDADARESIIVTKEHVLDYRKKVHKIIDFIMYIVFSFISSIFFGFGAIITQSFFNILFSMSFLLVGIIEVFAMVIYSLEFEL